MHLSHTYTRARACAFLGAVTAVTALTLGACSAPSQTETGGQPSSAGASTARSAISPLAGGSDTAVATETMAAPVNPAPKAGISPLGDANREMKTQRAEPPAHLLVVGVRTGKHQGFERVVFDLEGEGSPGWFIDYTNSPAQQGSGHPIKFQGATALNVNIDGTVLPFEMNRPDPNIGTVAGQGGFVTEVVSAGTFEGRSQFVIGLAEEHAYSVQVLPNPTRLVIDILEAA